MSQETVYNTKRVAKNTIILAARQLLVMLIALFTSRIVLEALGVVDYGIYNVVAGVSVTFVFFSTALSFSIQRFLSYEIGRENELGVQRYFSLSIWATLALSLIVLIIGLLIGPWLVYDVLVIPTASKLSALIVFYSMLVCLCITLVFSVYESMVIANENMTIYAYISIVDAIFKLAIAYAVMVMPHKLVTYGLLMVIALLLPKLILVAYCYRKYPASHIIRFWDKEMFKKLIGFSGWNVYSGLVFVINEQGLNVVLNMYFGPVVNAARGISTQVSSATLTFYVNFFVAVRPQIIKSYAAKAYEHVLSLLSLASRATFFIVLLFAVPVVLAAPQILDVWLTEVPGYAVTFVRWSIIVGLLGTFFNPLQTIAQATGELRKFTLWSLNFYLLAFPLAIVAISLGAPAWAVYPVLAFTRLGSALVAIPVLKKYVPIQWSWYFTKVIAPTFIIGILAFAISWVIFVNLNHSFWSVIIFAILSVLVTSLLIFSLGLTSNERRQVINKIKSFLHH